MRTHIAAFRGRASSFLLSQKRKSFLGATSSSSVPLWLFFSFFSLFKVLHAQEHYVLHSPSYNPGMFSLFSSVLGFLDFYEENGCGIEVDLGKKGVYYDKKKGANWWSYYFEPISIGARSNPVIEITDEQQSSFANKVLSQMSRVEAHRLIEKYIRIKAPLQKKIETFVTKQFKGNYVIGVHYRGTDKISETPRIEYETVYREIERAVEGRNEFKLFIATDEQPFLDAITLRYPGKVLSLNAIRSTTQKAVHASRKNAYQKGEEALLDCVLLSKTDLLIRTPSNLSACSALFNPKLSVIEINSAAR